MKKTLLIVLSLLLCAVTPLTVFATNEDSITVKATVSVTGNFAVDTDGAEIVNREISVTDKNSDGVFTLDDALVSAHEALCPDGSDGYASAETQYGVSILKLWGNESGSYGYFINNTSALSASDAVADGDSITAFVYSDTANFSDMFTWFDESEISATAGESFTVTLKGYTYDDSWNLVETECEGAKISVLNGAEIIESAVTGKDGTVSFKLDKGTYNITASSNDALFIVPSQCSATVTAIEEVSDSSSAESPSSSEAEASDSAAADEPSHGIPTYILIFVGLISAVIGYAVVRKHTEK